MATFKSKPYKSIHCGRKLIVFDKSGNYHTSDKDEIKAIGGALGVTEVKKTK
jgi:hypothetical protein